MRRAMLARWPRVTGHWWTIRPELSEFIRPVTAPTGCAWETGLRDPNAGTVLLRGVLREEPRANTLLLVVHGLGGDPQSRYCRRAARGAAARGWSCLRMGMRGSAGDGEDLYHAGLDSDLAHVLRDPSLAAYDRVMVLGYSLGGHLTLRHALQPDDRVTAVAAVSAPLDLRRSCDAIDRPWAWLYRVHVLRALKQSYRRVAERREVPTPPAEVARVRFLREWDRLTVVPRFGFDDVDDYYRRASVGPRLHDLRVPSLYVGMRDDPMVTRSTVEPSLASASTAPRLQQRWLGEGGHVAAPGSWEDDTLDWLDRQRR